MLKKLISILAASLLSWFVVYTLFHIPLTEPLAVHWTPEKPTQGWLQPDRLFIIVCTNQQSNENAVIRNLVHLKEVKESEYSNHVCTKNSTFHLKQPTEKLTTEYGDDLSFKVSNDNQNTQTIEINYTGDNILSGWFKYQVQNEQVISLESKVQSSFHILALILVGIVSIISAIVILSQKNKPKSKT